MIKINGLKNRKRNPDVYFFGNYSGEGYGDVDSSWLFYDSTGNGWGDGYIFGDVKGSGNSYFSCKLKKEYLK